MKNTHDVVQAIVVSGQGWPIVTWPWHPVVRAGLLTELTSDLMAFSLASAEYLNGGTVTLLLVRLEDARLLISPIEEARLVILASSACDCDMLSHEVELLADQIGQTLGLKLAGGRVDRPRVRQVRRAGPAARTTD